ncbi:MAG: hypothetical protein GY725_21560 [bacterium]|nr:hypothetical protein [bacterium]
MLGTSLAAVLIFLSGVFNVEAIAGRAFFVRSEIAASHSSEAVPSSTSSPTSDAARVDESRGVCTPPAPPRQSAHLERRRSIRKRRPTTLSVADPHSHEPRFAQASAPRPIRLPVVNIAGNIAASTASKPPVVVHAPAVAAVPVPAPVPAVTAAPAPIADETAQVLPVPVAVAHSTIERIEIGEPIDAQAESIATGPTFSMWEFDRARVDADQNAPQTWTPHRLDTAPEPALAPGPIEVADVRNAKPAHSTRRSAPGPEAIPAPMQRMRAAERTPVAAPLVQSIPAAWTEHYGYPITGFTARYIRDHGNAPALGDVLQIEVELGGTASGYVAPDEGDANVRFSLAKLPTDRPRIFYPGALRAVNAQIAAEFNRRGLMGVFVSPDPHDIDPVDVRDLRDGERSELALVVELARVQELRTVGAGDRVDPDDRVNHELHARLRRQSPVKPASSQGGSDLVRSDLLDDYLFRVNRHPGRRVDLSLAGSDQGGVTIDYLVTESKPWTSFMQYSNTGNSSTGGWRQHFGLVHNQLTNNDDTFSLNYVTTGFAGLQSVSTGYEAPWGDSQRLRWSIDGQFGSFEAEDVGFAGADFSSKTRSAGANLHYNIFQHRELFVDLTGGLHWQSVQTEHELIGQKGAGTFWMPRLGLAIERHTPYSRFDASLGFEKGIGTNGLDEIGQLGRTFPDTDWLMAKWDSRFSFYLEPVLASLLWSGVPRGSTQAHEIELGFRGQQTFGSRLVPQAQMVAGGMNSVRGYPEGAAAGDSVAIGQFQYNLNLPSLFSSRRKSMHVPLLGDFSFAPKQTKGRPDWDLTLHAFVDAARVVQNDRLSFESDRVLASAGIGAEIGLKSYLSLRLDYGRALLPAEGLTDEGDSRINAAITLRY